MTCGLFKKLYIFGKEIYFNMNTFLFAFETGHRNQSTDIFQLFLVIFVILFHISETRTGKE